MEEKQQTSKGSSCCICAMAPFIVGLVVALVFGWMVFPDLLYSQKEQPVAFSHEAHAKLGMVCGDCHFLREDGKFSGIPSTADCAQCHSVPLGDTKLEAKYVDEYVKTGKEVDWLRHQKQPDNVFFSHAAHSMDSCGTCHAELTEEMLCNQCHPSPEELDKQAALKVNVLTGYTKTTMKMWQCEQCHAHPEHYGVTNSNNACYTCHK